MMRSSLRMVVVSLVWALLFEAGATPTASVFAGQPPSPPASEQPAATPDPGQPSPTPAPDQTPIPDGSPSPSAPPVATPGVELVDMRTANSQTFDQGDGRFLTELFPADVFYQPDGQSDWQPIDTTLRPSNVDGVVATMDQAPAHLMLSTGDSPTGFAILSGAGHQLSFALPDGTRPGRLGTQPALMEAGKFADYGDFLPGGIGLRILPQSDGFKAFLILPARPAQDAFSFKIQSPDLALVTVDDGSIEIRDPQGKVVGRIPRPSMFDSGVVDGLGTGRYSEDASMDIVKTSDQTYVLTVTVDPAYLDHAVYPVYVDPSPTDFPTGSTTEGDTFAWDRHPTTNYGSYQNPTSPYYHDMTVGTEPGSSYLTRTFIKFNSLQETLGAVHIDSATLELYPWWQYYHYQWRDSYLQRVSVDPSVSWTASTLTWNNQPAVDGTLGHGPVTVSSKEANMTDLTHGWDVTADVSDVVNKGVANNGWRISKDDTGAGDWKRFIQNNEGGSLTPNLHVAWTAFVPAPGYPSGGGETSSRTLTWFKDATAPATTAFDAVLYQSDCSTVVIDSGTVTGSANSYMIPTSTSLTDGTTYCWKVKAKYGVNTSFSAWSSTASFVYRQGATLGLPSQDTFESFGLGSGDSASVNVSTGNLVISHPIVSLPIRGGSLGLELTYNSQSTANAGAGPGWRLNATRRLSELGNGDVVFTAGDGSVHTFTKISTVGTVTTYTRPSTVYGALRKDTSQTLEWTLTYRDQSVDSFDVSGSEGLLTKQADRFGNAVTFAYYSGTNRIKDATDPAGRVVDFAWNTGVSPARLTSITDWAYVSSGVVQSTATGSRRLYQLFYDSNGYLIGWSDPVNTTGSCPTQASHLTCLTYTSGLVTAIAKTQTYTTFSSGSLGTSTRTVTSTISYTTSAGNVTNEVTEFQDAEQNNATAPGTTFVRTAGNTMQSVRQGTPGLTTSYVFVSATDTLGRVTSVWRTVNSAAVEQRTVWDSTYPTERDSVTENNTAVLSAPARTVSYTYVSSSMGLVSRITEPLTGSTNRTTDYTYNSNNDVTQVIVALDASGTTRTITRYCYANSGCSTSAADVLAPKSVIENYVDGSKGGSAGNETDVTTDYQYDSYGQKTLETRWNYDASGTLLDSRSLGYSYDSNGNQTASIANYVDGTVSASGDDVTPNSSTGARTDITTSVTFDTAGNQISSSDPRRAIALALGQSLNTDDFVARFEFDATNEQTREQVARDPADTTSPKASLSTYDELGAVRQSTDFGGVIAATQFDRAGRSVEKYEDVDGAGGTAATKVTVMTFDAAGRTLTEKDRNQIGNSSLGITATTYDELGRVIDVTDASGSSPDVASVTHSVYDGLGRLTTKIAGYGTSTAQTTSTTYDLGGRSLSVDDEFTCTTTTYDYRHLALTETTGLDTGCSTGSEQRTITHTYDGLGRRTRSEVTAGSDSGDRTLDVTMDGAGHQLSSAVKRGGVTTTTTFTVNDLGQTLVETRPDGSTAKTNFDAAGNPTDRCYWKSGISVGDCFEVGHSPWSNPPTQVTTSAYDARNSRVQLSDSATGTTAIYDPDHNYLIKALYVPTSNGQEHQTLYAYDARHRLTGITQQLCLISSGHNCSTTTATGSDTYTYDDNDNRTQVNENNGGGSADERYCYDAQNRLVYRNTSAACSSSSKDETYTYDDAGNRLTSPGQTFTYSASGQLTGCTSGCGTVTHDSAGNVDRLGSWVYEYDSDGRLVRTCKATSCTGSIDMVEFVFDGEGHRTQIKEYVAGTLTTTRDFRYQGDAIVQELTNSVVTREYIVDDAGSIIRFCDPSCTSPTNTYLVTWNGHGDALGIWRVNSDGTLTLANSFTYSTWGSPSTTVASGFSDLGLRFLYVGSQDVQWDNFSGLGAYYMHSRNYVPDVGRFLQPDPARAETNSYRYADNSPVTNVDPTGNCFFLLYYTWKGCLLKKTTHVTTWLDRVGYIAARSFLNAGIGLLLGRICPICGATAGRRMVVGGLVGTSTGVFIGGSPPEVGDVFTFEAYENFLFFRLVRTTTRNGVVIDSSVQLIRKGQCAAQDNLIRASLMGTVRLSAGSYWGKSWCQ